MVQAGIRDNMCDTGTWLNETPTSAITIAMVADEQHDAHDMRRSGDRVHYSGSCRPIAPRVSASLVMRPFQHPSPLRQSRRWAAALSRTAAKRHVKCRKRPRYCKPSAGAIIRARVFMRLARQALKKSHFPGGIIHISSLFEIARSCGHSLPRSRHRTMRHHAFQAEFAATCPSCFRAR